MEVLTMTQPDDKRIALLRDEKPARAILRLGVPLIVSALGAKENTLEYTTQYVSIILLGSIFTMGSYTLGQLLRSEGSVK